MTRVLYWNIENFSRRKIQLPDGAAAVARDRFDHIVNVVTAAAPDVFVIVEVFDRTREVGLQGCCINTNANCAVATILMLRALRRNLARTWCLVPPLKVGNFGFRESVAVFYDSAALAFAGPNVWGRQNAGDVTQSLPPAGMPFAGLRDYNATWRGYLPAAGTAWRTAFAGGNQMVPENRGAARWEFRTALGARINFPGVDNRSPYLVHFRERGGVRRLLKIAAVHTSPSTAVAAINQLAAIPELAAPGAREASLVIGDFNVDTFDMNRNGCYGGLIGLGYQMMFSPIDPATGYIDLARKPYCMTHMLPILTATPYVPSGAIGPDAQHNVYPRLGYMGSRSPNGGLSSTGAIDNAFVLYGGAAAPGGGARAAIANAVIGKPYNQVAAPGGVTAELTGGPAIGSELATPANIGVGIRPLAAGIGPAATAFQAWPEYGHIRSTSDHLAIVADI